MYRRLSSSLPKDPEFGPDLKTLGYFVDEKDRIVKIEYPDEFFQFHITRNDRYNNVQREAMHGWIKDEVVRRMTALDAPPFYLPQNTSEKPNAPHVGILATPIDELRTKTRILAIVNDPAQDLGIYSYRDLSRESGIDGGSVVSTLKAAYARCDSASERPGIVVLNPGQLYFSHRLNKSMSGTSWDARPRKSAVHPAPRVDPIHNRVPGHETPTSHLQSVFENILANCDIVAADARIFIIACGGGCEQVLSYLHNTWPKWSSRIAAIALAEPYFSVPPTNSTEPTSPAHSTLNNDNSTTHHPSPTPTPTSTTTPTFSNFLAARARGWAISHHPFNTALANPAPAPAPAPATIPAATQTPAPQPAPAALHSDFASDPDSDFAFDFDFDSETARTLYPHLSSGVAEYAECIMPSAAVREAVLVWFDEVAAADAESGAGSGAGAGYCNPVFEVVREVVERVEGEVGEVGEDGW